MIVSEILDYVVVEAGIVSLLIEKVQAKIDIGWEPIGGIAANNENYEGDPNTSLLQAMVLMSDE